MELSIETIVSFKFGSVVIANHFALLLLLLILLKPAAQAKVGKMKLFI